MTAKSWLCVLYVFSLIACSELEDQTSNVAAIKPNQTSAPAKPIEGEGDYKFGMSFDDAMTAETGVYWEGRSLLKCRDEIPVKGCMLNADQERTYWPSFAGMALVPKLLFNQNAELTDLDLERRYEAGVTSVQCERIHQQLVDSLTVKYGAAESDKNQTVPAIKTGAGNPYYKSGEDKVLVLGSGPYAKSVAGTEVSLLTVFIGGSEYTKANCTPMIRFRGPKSLKRMPLLAKEIEAEPEENVGEVLANSAEDSSSDASALNEVDDY